LGEQRGARTPRTAVEEPLQFLRPSRRSHLPTAFLVDGGRTFASGGQFFRILSIRLCHSKLVVFQKWKPRNQREHLIDLEEMPFSVDTIEALRLKQKPWLRPATNLRISLGVRSSPSEEFSVGGFAAYNTLEKVSRQNLLINRRMFPPPPQRCGNAGKSAWFFGTGN